jgi:hypothetical protein
MDGPIGSLEHPNGPPGAGHVNVVRRHYRLRMADFIDQDLRGSWFEHVDLAVS